ncbi:MAG: trypsin-like peptidase domain-containing protein [Opitutaceae bacterium]
MSFSSHASMPPAMNRCIPTAGLIRIFAFVLCVASTLLSIAPVEARADMQRGFKRLLDSVVRIDVREIEFEAGTKRFAESIGSGVIFSEDGLVLTNAHVVSPRAVTIIVTLANLERVNASFVGWDHWTDLAVLRLDAGDLRKRNLNFAHAEFGDSDKLFAGEVVFAVGTPHGLARTVTRGIVSNNNRYFEDSRGVRGYETGAFNTWLQTDAAINPGNSGGPLVTENGKVIGINARAYVGADNLGFAIPGNVARNIAESLVKKGSIQRSYIGVIPGALQDLEQFYSLSVNTGMLVNSIDVGSPAAKAGLRGGDIILAIDGEKVDGRFPEQLPPIQNLIASKPAGTRLILTVKRNGDAKDIPVITEVLESRQGEEWAFEKWGLSVRKVSKAYARENQLSDATGLLVIGVQAGFPADVAGLVRGDIIMTVNHNVIADLETAKKLHASFEAHPEPTLVEARRNRSVSLYVLKP